MYTKDILLSRTPRSVVRALKLTPRRVSSCKVVGVHFNGGPDGARFVGRGHRSDHCDQRGAWVPAGMGKGTRALPGKCKGYIRFNCNISVRTERTKVVATKHVSPVQIASVAGAPPVPRWGSLQRSRRPSSWIEKGRFAAEGDSMVERGEQMAEKRRGRKGNEGEGREKKVRVEWKGRGGLCPTLQNAGAHGRALTFTNVWTMTITKL